MNPNFAFKLEGPLVNQDNIILVSTHAPFSISIIPLIYCCGYIRCELVDDNGKKVKACRQCGNLNSIVQPILGNYCMQNEDGSINCGEINSDPKTIIFDLICCTKRHSTSYYILIFSFSVDNERWVDIIKICFNAVNEKTFREKTFRQKNFEPIQFISEPSTQVQFTSIQDIPYEIPQNLEANQQSGCIDNFNLNYVSNNNLNEINKTWQHIMERKKLILYHRQQISILEQLQENDENQIDYLLPLNNLPQSNDELHLR